MGQPVRRMKGEIELLYRSVWPRGKQTAEINDRVPSPSSPSGSAPRTLCFRHLPTMAGPLHEPGEKENLTPNKNGGQTQTQEKNARKPTTTLALPMHPHRPMCGPPEYCGSCSLRLAPTRPSTACSASVPPTQRLAVLPLVKSLLKEATGSLSM